MRKIFFAGLLLAITTLNCFGQKHSVGLVFQPKLVYPFGDYKSPAFDTKLSYEIGLKYLLKIGTKLNLDSRLLYVNYRYGIDANEFKSEPFGDPFLERPYFKYSLKSISIPISLNYELINKEKYSIGIRGGFSFDKYLNREVEVDDEKIKNKNELKDFGFSGIIGVPLKYLINTKLSLLLEPQFNRNLVEIHETKSTIPGFYGFGINFGVAMSL